MDLGSTLVLKRSNHNLLDCVDTEFPEQPAAFEEDFARPRKFPRALQRPLVSGQFSSTPPEGLPPCPEITFPDLEGVSSTAGGRTGIPQAHSAPWIPIMAAESLAGVVEPSIVEEKETETPEIQGTFIFDGDLHDQHVTIDRECHVCHGRIEGNGFCTNGEYFHAACATCALCCSRVTGPQCAFVRDALVCMKCVHVTNPINRCTICGLACDGLDTVVHRRETDDVVHSRCLCCYLCTKRMEYGTHTFVQRQYLCRTCDKIVRPRVCAVCGEIVMESGGKWLGKWLHNEHFKCYECGCLLHGSCYIAHHNRPYCMKCGSRFKRMCAFCKQEIDEEIENVVRWRKKKYHVDCFVCWMCGKRVTLPHVKGVHNRPHCLRCYEMRMRGAPEDRRHLVWRTNDRRHAYEEELQETFIYPQYTEEGERFLSVTVEKKEKRLPLTKIPTTDDLKCDLKTKLLSEVTE